MKQLKRIKILIIICFFLTIIISSNNVLGHPASNVDLKFNFNEQSLTITISHNTDNEETHYIKKVDVYKNGIIIIDENYTNQPTSNTFTLYINVSANKDDVLKVETECSQVGKTEDTLTVKSTEDGISNEDNNDSSPGFELILFVCSIALILFLHKKKILFQR